MPTPERAHLGVGERIASLPPLGSHDHEKSGDGHQRRHHRAIDAPTIGAWPLLDLCQQQRQNDRRLLVRPLIATPVPSTPASHGRRFAVASNAPADSATKRPSLKKFHKKIDPGDASRIATANNAVVSSRTRRGIVYTSNTAATRCVRTRRCDGDGLRPYKCLYYPSRPRKQREELGSVDRRRRPGWGDNPGVGSSSSSHRPIAQHRRARRPPVAMKMQNDSRRQAALIPTGRAHHHAVTAGAQRRSATAITRGHRPFAAVCETAEPSCHSARSVAAMFTRAKWPRTPPTRLATSTTTNTQPATSHADTTAPDDATPSASAMRCHASRVPTMPSAAPGARR